jgi:hypothetical protein
MICLDCGWMGACRGSGLFHSEERENARYVPPVGWLGCATIPSNSTAPTPHRIFFTVRIVNPAPPGPALQHALDRRPLCLAVALGGWFSQRPAEFVGRVPYSECRELVVESSQVQRAPTVCRCVCEAPRTLRGTEIGINLHPKQGEGCPHLPRIPKDPFLRTSGSKPLCCHRSKSQWLNN